VPTWFCGHDPEIKQKPSQWKSISSPHPKARQFRPTPKRLLIYIYFDIQGIIHYGYAHKGETLNHYFYTDVLRRLWQNLRRKRPDKWKPGDACSITTMLHTHTHTRASTLLCLSRNEIILEKEIQSRPKIRTYFTVRKEQSVTLGIIFHQC